MAKPSIDELISNLISALDDDPTIIGNKIQIFSEQMATEYHTVLLPAAKDPTAWLFVSAKRPTKRPETLPSGAVCHSGSSSGIMVMGSIGGFGMGGTDITHYTFENEVWENGDHVLEGTITYEFGEIIDISFKIMW